MAANREKTPVNRPKPTPKRAQAGKRKPEPTASKRKARTIGKPKRGREPVATQKQKEKKFRDWMRAQWEENHAFRADPKRSTVKKLWKSHQKSNKSLLSLTDEDLNKQIKNNLSYIKKQSIQHNSHKAKHPALPDLPAHIVEETEADPAARNLGASSNLPTAAELKHLETWADWSQKWVARSARTPHFNYFSSFSKERLRQGMEDLCKALVTALNRPSPESTQDAPQQPPGFAISSLFSGEEFASFQRFFGRF